MQHFINFFVRKMFLKLSILLCLLVGTLLGKPTDSNHESSERATCKKVFENRGIKMEDFALCAAHGSHSLFLEDVRHFFEPAASEENGIPILNYNISDQDIIWPNSRLAGYDNTLLG